MNRIPSAPEPAAPVAQGCGTQGSAGSASAAVDRLDDPRVAAALEQYCGALETGHRPDRSALLAQFPLIAGELAGCLASLDIVYECSGAGPGEASLGPGQGEHSPLPVRRLGNFRLLRQIGRGGMGVVYEAEEAELNRRVALKVLPFAATLDRRQLARFKTEAQAAAGLHHTNIVPVYSFGCHDAVYYYAMQYIEGQTLAEVIAELRGRMLTTNQAAKQPGGASPADDDTLTATGGKDGVWASNEARDDTSSPAWPVNSSHQTSAWCRRVAEMGIQVAEALEHAHEQGIVHRDVKPSNLLLDIDGKVWVTDFGLAYIEAGTNLTFTGDVLGTLRYMSPEQARGRRGVVDHRSDVYSLGVTLYELLTLRPANSEDHRESLLAQVLSDDSSPPPAQFNRAIERDLETIVGKATAKAPQDRYQTARELADDLRWFLEGRPIRARRPTPIERLAKWTRRHSVAVVTGAMVSVLMALSLATVSGLWAQREHLARLDAETAQMTAEEARQAAETARIETRRRLANSLVATGARLMDDGDLLRSLPYFVAALQAEQGDPDREAVHRTRIAMTIDQCPRFTHCLRIAEGHVREVFFDDTDRCHAVVIDGREVQVWDVVEGRLAFPALMHDQDVEWTSIAPDRKGIVTTAANTARFWDLGAGTLRHEWSLPDTIRAVAFSDDGQRVAFSDEGNTVEVYDTDSGAAAGPRVRHPMGGGRREFLRLDVDGSRVVLGLKGDNPAGRLMMWDVASGEGSTVEPGHFRNYRSVAFSPDGRWLATGSFDATVRLTDTESLEPVMDAFEHRDAVDVIQFSADGHLLLTASWDGTARIWDLQTGGEKVFRLEHQRIVWRATFNPDGRYVVTAGDEPSLRIWEVATGKLAAPPLPHFAPVRLLAADRLSRRIATVAEDTVFLWDLALGEPQSVVLECKEFIVTTLAYLTCGDRLGILTHSGMTSWEIPNGKRVLEFKLPAATAQHCAVSPDGSQIVLTFHDGLAMVSDARTGHALFDPLRHDVRGWVDRPSFHGQRNWLLTVAGEPQRHPNPWGQPVWNQGRAHLWCLETGERLQRTFVDTLGVRTARFSPDGKWVVVAGASETDSERLEGFAEVWDVASDTLAGPIIVFPEPIFVARFSPDSTRLALGGVRQAQVFRVPDGEPLTAPFRHEGEGYSIQFDPQGERMLTPNGRLWDAGTGKPLTRPLHHRVYGTSFSVDGRLLGTGSGSRNWSSIGPAHGQLWDPTTGQPVSPALNHDLPMLLVTGRFSPDGRYFVTSSGDTTVRVWSILRMEEPADELMRLAELFSGHRLDASDSLAALTAEELDARWRSVARRHHSLVSPGAVQVSLWHRRQAAGAFWHGQIRAAIGHLDPDRRVGYFDGITYYLSQVRRNPVQAASLLEEIRGVSQEALSPEHPDVLNCVGNLVRAYLGAGRLTDALTLLDQTPKLKTVRSDRGYPDTYLSEHELYTIYRGAGRWDEAIAVREKTLELRKAKLRLKHPHTIISMNNLAEVYHEAGRLDEAIALHEHVLELRKTTLGPEHPETLGSMNNLAVAYRNAGRLDQAIALHEEELELCKATLGPEHASTLTSMGGLADAYGRAERWDEAIALHEQVLEMRKTTLGPEHTGTAGSMAVLALAYLDAGRHAEAEEPARGCLRIRQETMPDDWLTYNAMCLLGRSLAGQARFADAEPLLLDGYQGMIARETSIPAVGKVRITEALDAIIQLYEDWDKPDEAERWRQQRGAPPDEPEPPAASEEEDEPPSAEDEDEDEGG